MSRVRAILLVFLVATGACLYAFPAATIPYAAGVLLHAGAGLALAARRLALLGGESRRLSRADRIEVQWPSGQEDKLSGVAAGQTITIEEGRGQVAARPYGKK